ncbi:MULTISPECIES: nuclear transport factor 2 family protein [unclassified Lysobacter]|uniref:nuclear transport factor 2 family protein n=1 Tax=unclassified Lysobacter TaxID=2635362 RepID=UPI001BEC81EA|nr:MULTISPECIES: nuclear transport factor 2 family protein [unclassified Lysobacter]MBT2751941.1 nuclear transport factor 2 family protein [Lysobacter sp. ISL-50]MBT2783162.1 nuclear transport factor 2 family protein [Lysobacter sp. ISL-52]
MTHAQRFADTGRPGLGRRANPAKVRRVGGPGGRGRAGRGAVAARALRAMWLPALLALLAACGPGAPPEQRLRAAMEQLQGAIEKRDASAIDAQLSKDFVGPDGLDRASARRLAAASFLRYRAVGIKIVGLDVNLQPGHATVRFNAALSGGSGQVLPDAAQLYEVQTGWREEDGEWRMTSAQWTPRL